MVRKVSLRKTKLSKLESDVANIWNEIKILSEQTVKQENLHKKFLQELAIKIDESHEHAKKSSKEILKANKFMQNLSTKAVDIEETQREVKQSTAEVEDTAKIFVKRFDEINDKTNAYISKLVDVMNQVEALESKMSQLSDAPTKLNEIHSQVSKHEEHLQEVKEALDSIQQFKNKHGRTIIID
ncbi:MAG: hypothetical protein AABW84_00260 [Nanoarchaeota archaeon]